MKARITIGIPCYQGVTFEVLEDYMRFAFYLGRRYQEYEFYIAIKGKSEQFRARNAIVDQFLHTDSDYILMLDDDHILDVGEGLGSLDGYEFLKVLIGHMENDPEMGIVGALYSQRGGEYNPVVMQEKDGEPYFLTPMEISGRPQKVAVTGGGCMLVRREVFEKLKRPWFEPEFHYGTDIQICRKARKVGFGVWCDTSLEIGHVKLDREIVLPSKVKMRDANLTPEAIETQIKIIEYLDDYSRDVLKYSGKMIAELHELAEQYQAVDIEGFGDNYEEYYRSLGMKQLARNFCFNFTDEKALDSLTIIKSLSDKQYAYGLDYCCGSAPLGFALALKGKKMDFIDIDGAESYNFVKWRAKELNVEIGTELKGTYDFVLLMDAIEHLKEWEEHLAKINSLLRPGALLITNFFSLYNYSNPEHISMNKFQVEGFLIDRGYSPITLSVWVKGGIKDGKRSDIDARSKD